MGSSTAVHLQPVLFHTMFDPRPGDALEGEIGNIGNDFPLELGADLFSKEAHDLLGAKAQRAMTQ